MYRKGYSGHQPWLLISVKPAIVAGFRHWNLIAIWSLAFVVLSVFAMGLTPQTGHAYLAAPKVPLKIDENPTLVSLAHGVQVQNLTPAIPQNLGISADTRGVVITSVDPTSATAFAGLERGDVIQEVNRKPVHNVEEFHRQLEGAHGEPVLLLVSKSGSTHSVVVEPQ